MYGGVTLCALTALKTSKATNNSFAGVSPVTQRRINFEFREPSAKLKFMTDNRMTLRASPGKRLRIPTHF